MTMHLYRDAYEHALYTGDDTDLKKFKHKIIITYDGPGLRNYHNKGVRVYPETNLKKILAKRASMTAQERARFDADRKFICILKRKRRQRLSRPAESARQHGDTEEAQQKESVIRNTARNRAISCERSARWPGGSGRRG
jgi:hypothetical protein